MSNHCTSLIVSLVICPHPTHARIPLPTRRPAHLTPWLPSFRARQPLKCGDTVLPEVVVARHLKVFLQDDLERLFPKNRWVRTVAHPTRLPAQKEFRVAQATPGAVEDERQADGHVKTTPASGLRFADVVPPKG